MMLLYFLQFLFTFIVFYVGYNINPLKNDPCPSKPSVLPSQSVKQQPIDCPKPIQNLIVEPDISSQHSSQENNVCLRESFPVYMHLGPSSVTSSFISTLHHPSSPSKDTIFLTSESEWPNQDAVDKKCDRLYISRTGSRASQPNKCIAVAHIQPGFESPQFNSYRIGETAGMNDQYQHDYSRDFSLLEETELLPPLLQELSQLTKQFQVKMGNPINSDGTRRSVIVMVANEGVMDLVLNFMCSGESAGIDLKSVVVFVGTQEYIKLIEDMGGNAIYSPALGSMPAQAAGGYLDKTFSRMMWFKTTSVYLALNAGFHVLFQDVDLVWLKDPIPYLNSLHPIEAFSKYAHPNLRPTDPLPPNKNFPFFQSTSSSPSINFTKENNHSQIEGGNGHHDWVDIYFMDDGARTPRYTPYFVNSGFFYMKYNKKTLYFQEKFMKSGPSEIGYSHSHQSVMIRHLAEAVEMVGLTVGVLDPFLFASGEAYHEKKNFIVKIQAHTFMPYVFHMCWTDNRENKVVYFKTIDMWYLPDDGHSPDNSNPKTGIPFREHPTFRAEVGSPNDVCISGKKMLNYVLSGDGESENKSGRILDFCCQRKRYWKPVENAEGSTRYP